MNLRNERKTELKEACRGTYSKARKKFAAKLNDSSLIDLELASKAKLRMSPQRSYSELAVKLELSFAAKLNVGLLGFFRTQMLSSLSFSLDQWSTSHWFVHHGWTYLHLVCDLSFRRVDKLDVVWTCCKAALEFVFLECQQLHVLISIHNWITLDSSPSHSLFSITPSWDSQLN